MFRLSQARDVSRCVSPRQAGSLSVWAWNGDILNEQKTLIIRRSGWLHQTFDIVCFWKSQQFCIQGKKGGAGMSKDFFSRVVTLKREISLLERLDFFFWKSSHLMIRNFPMEESKRIMFATTQFISQNKKWTMNRTHLNSRLRLRHENNKATACEANSGIIPLKG